MSALVQVLSDDEDFHDLEGGGSTVGRFLGKAIDAVGKAGSASARSVEKVAEAIDVPRQQLKKSAGDAVDKAQAYLEKEKARNLEEDAAARRKKAEADIRDDVKNAKLDGKVTEQEIKAAAEEKAALMPADDGMGNPLKPKGEGEPPMRQAAKRLFQQLSGGYGEIIVCNAKTLYTWFVFFAIFAVAWVRAIPVVNQAFRMHMVALQPRFDAGNNVVLQRRASRFVVFAILFLMITAACLYLGITLLVAYTLLMLIEMLADNMPNQLWVVSDFMRALFGCKTFFGAFQPRHFKIHGIVLAALIAMCWFYAFVYLREPDLVHGNLLRDKVLRCVVGMPFVAMLIYGLYAARLIIKECF